MAKSKSKSKYKTLSEKLTHKKKSAWTSLDNGKVHAYCNPYMKFLGACKTEREVVEWAEKQAKKAGFKDIDTIKHLKRGDCVYKKTHKTFVLIRFKDFNGINAVVSHIDSPRLDLKPNPLLEDSGLSLLKTHYYGGIVKYQWVNIPLSLHGVIYTRQGKRIDVNLGEKESDPVLVISDLLPHLGRERHKATADKLVVGENLNVVCGTIPIDDSEIQEQVKLNTLRILHENYGIIEEDLVSAELELVPAFMPRECGLDRSMIAGYGQDDRVCAYAAFDSLLKSDPKQTSMAILFDKEEIGSEGKTGAKSDLLKHLLEEMIQLSGTRNVLFSKLMQRFRMLSGDVTAAFDPNYKEVFEPANSSYLGKGVSIEKYTGYGGKYSGNDASAEYFFKVRSLLNKNKIPWQAGEIGKIDEGGGGTIAVYVAALGADVIDAGPCVLGMHSPYELCSKADIYSTFMLYKSFYEQMS